MSGVVTASVAAVASVGMGAYEASQANSNASQQLGMEKGVYNEQQYYAAQLQKLISDPSSVTSLPGYQFQFQQGQSALQALAASKDQLGSGQLGIGLTEFGQQEAQTAYGQQVGILSGLSGLQASASPAQYGQAATGAQASASQQTGSQLASLMYLAGMGKNPASPMYGMWGGAGTPMFGGGMGGGTGGGIDMSFMNQPPPYGGGGPMNSPFLLSYGGGPG